MILIYLSGIDGCGKTTQAEKLSARLNEAGFNSEYQWLRWEPSIVPLIKKITRLLGRKSRSATNSEQLKTGENADHASWSDLKQRLLSIAPIRWVWLKYATDDYFSAYKKISPTWKADYVIMDRYLFDFTIDQAINVSMKPEVLDQKLRRSAVGKMQRPDLSIIINLPAEIGYQRKMDGTPVEYLQQREACYQAFATGENAMQVDGTLSVDEINDIIYTWIIEKIGK
jgi:thymidylate kinase